MKHYYYFIFLFISTLTFAQRTATKTLTFDSNVEDLIIVPFNGIAAISDDSKIHGYNPDTEELIWSVDIPTSTNFSQTASLVGNGFSLSTFSNTDADFVVIPDTPFLQKFFDNRLYIINSFNGDILFSPLKDEFFFQAEYLFDEDAILLRGLQDKSLLIAKYSLKEKEYLWKTIASEKFANAFTKLTSAMGDDPTAGKDEMQYSEDKVFILAKSKFYVLDKKNGELLWKVEDDKKNVDSFFNSLNGSYVLLTETVGLLGNKELLDLRDAATGNKIWKEPIKTKYLVLFEDWQDKMLLAHYRGFNFYDYKTGTKLWEKDPKGKGIKSVIPFEQDFLYVYDDEMMLLDKNGQKKWKKDVEISDDEEDPIFFLEKTDNGKILYVTATYANLVDYATGQKIWKKNLKLKNDRPTFAKYDDKTGDFVIYNDEKLFRFNETSTERPEPYAKLKLKNEQSVSSLDLYADNITITGQNEVVGVDNKGTVLFHNKYVQPGEFARKFGKAALQLGSTVAAIATVEYTTSTTYRDANGNMITNTSEPKALFGERAKAIGEAGYIAGTFSQQFVQDRFNALQEDDKDAIIFAKGDNKERLLIKVDKETGKEEDKIIVKNTKPVYDYDAVSGDLYYSKGKEVMIFKSL